MMRTPNKRFQARMVIWLLITLSACLGQAALHAQTDGNPSPARTASPAPKLTPPVMDNGIFAHILFDQLEGRTNGLGSQFRWDGEGWVGTDMNRLWLKTEGFAGNGSVSDGDQEALYDRPIPRMRYFDMQAGIREDLDSGPRRTWAALGIEGLAPFSFEIAPTFYIRDEGNVAGRVEGSYDLLLTQRLVAQPEVELNFYNKDDPARRIGSGVSEIDTGFRLRYEFSRKFAPYIGYAFNGTFGDTASYAKQVGETDHDSSFIYGIRMWY